MKQKKCGTCRHWDPICYGEDTDEIDFSSEENKYVRGNCLWTSTVFLPACLKPEDGLLHPVVLAGSGRGCEAWKAL